MPRGVKLTSRQRARRLAHELTTDAHKVAQALWMLKCKAGGLKVQLEACDFACSAERIGAFLKGEAAHYEDVLRNSYGPLQGLASQINALDHLLNPDGPP